MSSIHVQILAGPDTGRSGSFIDSPVTFGRNPDNTVVLDTPLASRQHGALVLEDDAWCVVNQSTNGTTVNGRKKVGDKPVPLRDGDTVGVGKKKLFQVNFEQTTYESAAVDDAADKSADPIVDEERAAAAKKAKLWVGIGIYLCVSLGGLAVLMLMGDGDKQQDDTGKPTVALLSREQIAETIRKPVNVRPDERAASRELDNAQRAYARRDERDGELYRAHRAFKEALAYSGQTSFNDGMVIRTFDACEKQLIDTVTTHYYDAVNYRRSRKWEQASRALRQLLIIYPEKDTLIYNNVLDQLDLVRRRKS